MKIRFEDQILARQLRGQGCSFSEIMEKIPDLSKGTLNGWLKNIELTPEQKERLLLKIKNGGDRGRLKGAFTNHQKRIDVTKQIIFAARKESKGRFKDPFFTAGVMIYWAEGDKTKQERVAITNSDPIMIQLMMNWFRKICNVPEKKFRIALSIMTLHDRNESERFWSRITGIPIRGFHKTRIKPTLLRGRRNPSYMGTCRIIVADKNLFRKIMGWRLGIIENFKYLPL